MLTCWCYLSMTSRTCVPVERPANVNPLFLSISSVFFSLSGLSNSRIYLSAGHPLGHDAAFVHQLVPCATRLSVTNQRRLPLRPVAPARKNVHAITLPRQKVSISVFGNLEFISTSIFQRRNTWELLLRRFRCLCQ